MAKEEYTGWEEALARIETAKDSNASELDLSGLQLTAVPDAISRLTELQRLNLTRNRLTSIPQFDRLVNLKTLILSENQLTSISDSLAQLTNLFRLDLDYNRITDIPDFLGELPNLTILFLNRNQITAIPESFGRLTTLSFLIIANNNVTFIPDSFAKLRNLERLDIYDNKIASIPDSFGQLTKLTILHVGYNLITAMPASFARLTNLQELSIQGNQITAIPETIAQLSNLEVFRASGNGITALPDSLHQLTKLKELDLEKNQIRRIPHSLTELNKLEVLKLEGNPLPEELLAAVRRGVPSLYRYLESTAEHRVYPRTVKLILLGEPKSGKTTLLEALKGNPRPCDESRPETIGVNVVTLERPHPGDKPLYLSVWDFAGQHMEHATHQFFLTENAVYLILWNARLGIEAGKRDLWYWLELLKMRVRDPKFLLVATHTERTPPDLPLSDIQRTYTGCQGDFPVELSDLKGLKELEAKILELAVNSPSLRAEWPSEWLKVRDEIRKIRAGQPYITPAEFRGLLKRNGIIEPQAQTDVAAQLHQLGEILYYQERDELSTAVILDAKWVTELIALVVRSKEVRNRRGMLKKSDLDALWGEDNPPADVRRHLIYLMDWYDLTYSTDHQLETGIVVEALPYSTPDELKQVELDPNQPQIQMIFGFPALRRHLPPGIPTWAFARAHRFSARAPWRDAALFADEGTKSQALILSSDAAREVHLHVAADYPPYFFGLLEAILRDTFKRYPGAEPERRLPCPCQPSCPTSYLYDTVVKRWKDRKVYVTCDKSGEDVAIETLLSGIHKPETAEGLNALRSEMRRIATEQIRAQNEQMKKSCPSVFTLVPSRDFKQLDTWFESMTEDDELELALYCEHDSGWHPTSHSLYRFRASQKWFEVLKKGWNGLVRVTKYVGPLTKAAGKAGGLIWAEAGGLAIEKLPEISVSETRGFSGTLGEKARPTLIDLETRHILEQLINHLDSQRPQTLPKRGGLHPHLVEDGRLLWLCPEHLERYQART